MISISWIVLLNNVISILAGLCCFIHALHSGIHTSNTTKLVLYSIGIVFFSATVDIKDVIMPGYKYIMFANVLFSTMAMTYFIMEARRFGLAQQWYQMVRNLLHFGDRSNVTKK